MLSFNFGSSCKFFILTSSPSFLYLPTSVGHTLDPTLIPIWIRFIPTHVGHTIPSGIGIPPHPVHPHIRGAYASRSAHILSSTGSSPHTWGIRPENHQSWQGKRFIPTYVGHTLLPAASCAVPTVHPHIRGAYAAGRGRFPAPPGSSPHTWGIRSKATDITT